MANKFVINGLLGSLMGRIVQICFPGDQEISVIGYGNRP